jgi:hypothetical protein
MRNFLMEGKNNQKSSGKKKVNTLVLVKSVCGRVKRSFINRTAARLDVKTSNNMISLTNLVSHAKRVCTFSTKEQN